MAELLITAGLTEAEQTDFHEAVAQFVAEHDKLEAPVVEPVAR